jgi:hypothetical protein
MAEERTISNGTYLDPSGEQKIIVRDSRIHFLIALEKGRADRRLDREYDYSVDPDGRIQPRPLVSSDAVLGVAKFDWRWDGKVISQSDPATKEVTIFNARPKPPK